MTYQTLTTHWSGDVLEIGLHRPEKMNAINIVMLQELAAVFDGPGMNARAILVHGNERAFCAGQDLTDPGLASPDQVADFMDRHYNPLIRRMTRFPVPVVGCVRGVASGAGCSLALTADIVIASETARFDAGFVRIGLVPDCGASYVLPRLIGQARAQGMMLLGQPIDGLTAQKWGLIWQAVPDAETDAVARKIAAALASGPSKAHGLIKKALEASAAATFDEQLNTERDLQAIAARTEDFAEGLAAFRQKRPPEFKGR